IQLVVPNAMTAREGMPELGDTLGPRTLDNTGHRRFVIMEFDLEEKRNGQDTKDAPFLRRMADRGISLSDINATLIHHLATKWPLAMAVHSGGKSLHGWFRAEGEDEDALENFFRYGITLGADYHL